MECLAEAPGDVGRGVVGLRSLLLLRVYGGSGCPVDARPADEGGGTAAPVPVPLHPPPRLPLLRIAPGEDALHLDAEVCVVGSGAGGSVVARVLARSGIDVVVLEAGRDEQEPDHPRGEADAYGRLYWRGGPTPTADGSVTLLAGTVLGGGTTVNWMNCVRPSEQVRREWREAGLEGVDGPAFDRILDAVASALGATARFSERNGPNARLAEGAAALGWSWRPAERSVDPRFHRPEWAGCVGWGDRSGSRRGALRPFLEDAVGAGARIVAGARALQVEVRQGRAVGVRGEVAGSGGTRRPLRVRASTVVLAGGALETPALLLRSGIGGPAAGHHLHLHPVNALLGFHDGDQNGGWGPPQAVVVDHFQDSPSGSGFLLETPHHAPGLLAASLPFRTPAEHRRWMERSREAVPLITVVRDVGSGRVTLDRRGEAVVTYPLDDARDRSALSRALEALVRLQVAAGAREILDVAPGTARWHRGRDPEGFLRRILAVPHGAGGRPLFSAHQMGSARMGSDRRASVADPWGELHDVAGVWIGDTGAFPSAVGVNPMLTCMALAWRTSEAILASRNPGE